MSGIANLVNHIKLPQFVKARQLFEHNEISREEILKKLKDGLGKQGIQDKIKKGQRICITCGSRGIDNMDFILKALVDYLKSVKAGPS